MLFLDEIEQYGIDHGGEPMTDNVREFMSRLMGASDLFQNIEDRLRFPSLIRGDGGVVLKFKSPEDLRNAFQKRGIRVSKKDSVEYFNALRDPKTQKMAVHEGRFADRRNKKLHEEAVEEAREILEPYSEEEIAEMIEENGGGDHGEFLTNQKIKEEVKERRRAYMARPYRPGLAGLSIDEITEISTEEFDAALDSYYDALRIKAFGIDEAE
jgi:hypothetical protein